jgi:FkbM family methyltransferase
MVRLVRMTLTGLATQAASRVWKTLRLHRTPLRRIADDLGHATMPLGLPSPYGTLYGWTLHEMLHTPETETIAFFKKNLKEGDRVADVGANIGFYTLQFSSLVGETGKVVAFEPSPYAYRCLSRAVKGRQNVELVHKGVYSDARTLDLYSRKDGHGMASVMYQAGEKATSIELMPLKDHPEDFSWVKIDVEGAELEVLKGMRTTTRCVLEVAKGILEEHGEGVPAFLQRIEELGYRVHFIVEGGETVLYDHTNLGRLVNNIYIEPA